MIAFQVEIDGHKTMLAGVEDWSILALHVNAIRNEEGDGKDQIEFRAGGLSLPNGEDIRQHFHWAAEPLQIGSAISIRVVEVDRADPPLKRYRSDAEVRESPFTEEEWRELRYQDYLKLKAEFEQESA